MSKKLFRTIGKIAGVVAAVAGIVLAVPTGGASLGLTAGIGGILGTVAAVASVVSIGAGLLGRPKSPSASPANKDRLFASIDPRTPRKMVFGNTAMATDIRDQEYSSAQDYLHRFIVVASHAVQSIDTIYFDDKIAWTLAGGAQGEFAGYLTVTPILEGNAGNAINIGARMGTSRRYTGCAYVHIQYKLTGNTKKTESPFAQSVPTRMTIIGKGWKTYDPRLDSTVAGGSGSHRANDQTTWAWDANASRNPAIQLLNYYLGWKIAGKLAVGKGIPSSRIDLPSFITAANICDESVALAAGGSEPRYRSDGVFSESDALSTVNENFKASMNAELDDIDGKIRLTVIHNDLADGAASDRLFTDDDILGDVDWNQTAALDDSFNAVRGTYVDASANALYQSVDYPQPTPLTSPDGIDRILTFDLPMVQSSGQAQRLAKQALQRQQYTGTLSFVGQATWWRVQRLDIIRLTFSPLGMVDKLFRVMSLTMRTDGTVPVVLMEENSAIYAWSASDVAAVSAAAPTLYDFTKNPVYQDIQVDTVTGYLTNESVTLAADASGTVSSFATAAGVFKVFDGLVDVTTSATFSEVSETNCTGTINATTGAYSVTAMSADAAEYKVRAVYNGVTIDKIFSIAKSRAGNAGSNGTNGSAGNVFKRIYKRSATAPSSPSGNMTPSGWSTTIPADDGNPVYASDAEISGADGTTLVGSWSTPIIFQATTPVSASETITLTSQSETTAAIKRTIVNGGSLKVDARFRSGTTAGSGTQTYKTEWRVAGGSWATLKTVNQAYVTGEVITLNASGTLTNSSGFDQAYEIRAVASVSGGGGETVVENRSYVTA